MKTLATLAPLTTQLIEIQHLSSAASLLSWDQETYMPTGGGHARAEQIATLQTLAHDRFVSPDIERVLSQWIDPSTGEAVESPGDAWDNPPERSCGKSGEILAAPRNSMGLCEAARRETSLAQQVWVEARKKSDFRLFLPHLKSDRGAQERRSRVPRLSGYTRITRCSTPTNHAPQWLN